MRSLLLLVAAAALPAQQLDTQTLTTTVRGLRRTAQVSDEVKAKADKLITDSLAGDTRRHMANALALLKGETWDSKREWQWSLVLRPDQVVADPSAPVIARLTQIYPARYNGSLKLRASLVETQRPLGTFDITSRDLGEQPFGFDLSLDGVPNGAYKLRAEILDGETVAATLETPLQLVNGIESQRSAIEKRLVRIQGHDSTKATVRYPYELARTVNIGRRLLSPIDFGLPFTPQLPYDFAKGVQHSTELLKALESGKDLLYRAKGDHQRHYWFEEAREMMEYRVYVSTKWDGKSKLPMVLVLHGNTRDDNFYFDRDENILAKLAEQHGYLVVCPMGYRPSAGWGAGRAPQSALSEKDALHVYDLITKEYPVDPARTYLFGHSAGGAGTWYLGQKYAERWAAIAASAAATRPAGFPFDRLKGMPIMVCHGDQDDEVPVASSRNMVKAAKENGLDPQYLEMPGATHATIVALIEPKVFDFFDQHHK
jgi:pimeloyl-ACP methyl ester carboxylesterase